MFHKFFDEGYETVHDVIDTPIEELVNTLGIEKEKIEAIVGLLKKGLEDAEIEDSEDGGQSASPGNTVVAEAAPEKSETSETTEEVTSDAAEASGETDAAPHPEATEQPEDDGKQPL
jgi:hypothetical protein